ncbi:MAG: SiaB family protein kinase, partial [Bacteroidota bacterium]|nr:SiaB family protein kinase [Bacteroidota bacterium]
MKLIKKLRKKLSDEHLMFAYRGEVTGDNSVSLLTLLEREMEFSDFSMLGRKRLFMFVLENLQNITRHGISRSEDITSLVVYSKTPDGYTVSTGNALKKSEVRGLRKNLQKINNLDPDKIREVYRTMLQDTKIGKKGGAGLGLMEMARKTGNRLDYDFYPIDDRYSYFILSKTIDSGGKGITTPEQDQGESTFDSKRI